MSYPGNPSLPQEIKDRISGTFEQTLELAAEGKDQEALVGCDFVLRLDPDYQPAKTLTARLRSGERPVMLDDLRGGGEVSPPKVGDGPAEVDSELIEARSAPVAKPTGGLAAVLHDLLIKGNYHQVLQIAETQKETIEKDPQLQDLIATARDQLTSTKVTAPEDSDLLELQRQSLALDDGLEDPFADDTDLLAEVGDGDDLLEAEEIDEIPGLEALDEIPGAEVFDEIPAIEALEEIPAIEALEQIPGTDAFEELPGGETLEEAPPDQAPVVDPLDELETLSFDEIPSSADEPVLEPTAEYEGVELDMLSLEGEAQAPETVVAEPEPEEEGGDRIAQLLSEGQEIFERGEFQGAIDVWSRIFLIDIDNDEASRRIEEARNKKAELERQAEEFFHEGVAHIERKQLDEAKESFRQVLGMAPSHTLAREYLEQLEAGEVPTVVRGGAEVDAAALAEELAGTAERAPAGVQSMEAAVQRDRIVVVKKTDKRLIAMGGVVLVLVVLSVAFLVIKWDDLFPNTEAVVPGLRQIDPITRATQMHEAGNTENAIAVLEKIPAADPTYADAQALIAQWKALVEAPQEVEDTGPSPELIERRNLLLNAARDAHAQRQYIRSRNYFEQAGKVAPLTTGDLTLRRDCDLNLEHLTAEIRGYEDGEYATILPRLWRLRDARPHDNDIVLLIVNSYYNLALTDLQRGDPMGAVEKTQEALEVQPDNNELERLRLFAMTYTDKPQDLLYRIYVKYLPSR